MRMTKKMNKYKVNSYLPVVIFYVFIAPFSLPTEIGVNRTRAATLIRFKLLGPSIPQDEFDSNNSE